MEPRKLPQEIIARLRSGFSISSVAHSVNELVLNSLDAKSKNIAVRINLQTYWIQVVDDGDGISKDNLQWVGTRYMTNKCHTLKDFQKITKFLGYKGESLASIKEHAKRIVISTKCSGSQETFSKTLDGDVVKISDRPSQGTTVTIEDFLYNLPVRRNVVNADLELGAIRSNLEALSVIHPTVSFTLRNDVNRKMIYSSFKCESVELSLINMYPRLKSEHFGALKLSSPVLSVIGLIYKKLVDFKAQHVYVNKRAVECNALHRLVFDELINSTLYKNEKNEMFCYLFNIKCPNSNVNFSMHGSKTFVEFKEWNAVVSFIHKFMSKFLKREGLELVLETVDEIKRKAPSLRDIRLSAMGGACKSKVIKRKEQECENKIEITKSTYKPKRLNKKEEKVTFNTKVKHRKLAKQLILSASKIDKNVFKKLFSGRISDDGTSKQKSISLCTKAEVDYNPNDEDNACATMKSVDTFWNINNQQIGKALVMDKFLKSVGRRDKEVCEEVAASVSIKISRKRGGKFKPSLISTMSFMQTINVKSEFLSNDFESIDEDFREKLNSRFDEEFDFVEDFHLEPNFTKSILKKSTKCDNADSDLNTNFTKPERCQGTENEFPYFEKGSSRILQNNLFNIERCEGNDNNNLGLQNVDNFECEKHPVGRDYCNIFDDNVNNNRNGRGVFEERGGIVGRRDFIQADTECYDFAANNLIDKGGYVRETFKDFGDKVQLTKCGGEGRKEDIHLIGKGECVRKTFKDCGDKMQFTKCESEGRKEDIHWMRNTEESKLYQNLNRRDIQHQRTKDFVGNFRENFYKHHSKFEGDKNKTNHHEEGRFHFNGAFFPPNQNVDDFESMKDCNYLRLQKDPRRQNFLNQSCTEESDYEGFNAEEQQLRLRRNENLQNFSHKICHGIEDYAGFVAGKQQLGSRRNIQGGNVMSSNYLRFHKPESFETAVPFLACRNYIPTLPCIKEDPKEMRGNLVNREDERIHFRRCDYDFINPIESKSRQLDGFGEHIRNWDDQDLNEMNLQTGNIRSRGFKESRKVPAIAPQYFRRYRSEGNYDVLNTYDVEGQHPSKFDGFITREKQNFSLEGNRFQKQIFEHHQNELRADKQMILNKHHQFSDGANMMQFEEGRPVIEQSRADKYKHHQNELRADKQLDGFGERHRNWEDQDLKGNLQTGNIRPRGFKDSGSVPAIAPQYFRRYQSEGNYDLLNTYDVEGQHPSKFDGFSITREKQNHCLEGNRFHKQIFEHHQNELRADRQMILNNRHQIFDGANMVQFEEGRPVIEQNRANKYKLEGKDDTMMNRRRRGGTNSQIQTNAENKIFEDANMIQTEEGRSVIEQKYKVERKDEILMNLRRCGVANFLIEAKAETKVFNNENARNQKLWISEDQRIDHKKMINSPNNARPNTSNKYRLDTNNDNRNTSNEYRKPLRQKQNFEQVRDRKRKIDANLIRAKCEEADDVNPKKRKTLSPRICRNASLKMKNCKTQKPNQKLLRCASKVIDANLIRTKHVEFKCEEGDDVNPKNRKTLNPRIYRNASSKITKNCKTQKLNQKLLRCASKVTQTGKSLFGKGENVMCKDTSTQTGEVETNKSNGGEGIDITVKRNKQSNKVNILSNIILKPKLKDFERRVIKRVEAPNVEECNKNAKNGNSAENDKADLQLTVDENNQFKTFEDVVFVNVQVTKQDDECEEYINCVEDHHQSKAFKNHVMFKNAHVRKRDDECEESVEDHHQSKALEDHVMRESAQVRKHDDEWEEYINCVENHHQSKALKNHVMLENAQVRKHDDECEEYINCDTKSCQNLVTSEENCNSPTRLFNDLNSRNELQTNSFQGRAKEVQSNDSITQNSTIAEESYRNIANVEASVKNNDPKKTNGESKEFLENRATKLDQNSPLIFDNNAVAFGFTQRTSLFNFCSPKPEEITSQDVKFNISINFEELFPSNRSKFTENVGASKVDVDVSFERPDLSNYLTDGQDGIEHFTFAACDTPEIKHGKDVAKLEPFTNIKSTPETNVKCNKDGGLFTDVKSVISSPIIKRTRSRPTSKKNAKSEKSTGDIVISLNQEEKRILLLREFETRKEERESGIEFSEGNCGLIDKFEARKGNSELTDGLEGDACLGENSKLTSSDIVVIVEEENAKINVNVNLDSDEGVDYITADSKPSDVKVEEFETNCAVVNDVKINGDTHEDDNKGREANLKQVVVNVDSENTAGGYNAVGYENPESDWWRTRDVTGRTFFIHKRTGVATYNTIKENGAFTMLKRSEFVPKGQSPILMTTEPTSVSLTSSGKVKLYNALADSYKEELGVIKWNKIIQNKDPRKFFDEIYKHLPRKSPLPVISLEDNKLILRKSCHFTEEVVFSKEIFDRVKVIGQWDKKFIVTVSQDATLILFDQHAVHERIRVEKLFKEYITEGIGKDGKEQIRYKCNRLKNKFTFDVTEEKVVILKKYNEFFHRLGLWYTINKSGVVLSSVPACLYNKVQRQKSSKKLKDLVVALIEEEVDVIRTTNGIPANVPKLIQNVVNSEACRGSVMFGDALDFDTCSELISKLKECNLPFQCAHGRPTLTPIMNMTMPEGKVVMPNLKKLT